MAIAWATLTNNGFVSVERDDVGNGHIDSIEIAYTICHVCPGVVGQKLSVIEMS